MERVPRGRQTRGAYGTVRPGPGQVTDWLARPDLLARLAARRGTLPDPPAEAALEEALKAVGELSPEPGQRAVAVPWPMWAGQGDEPQKLIRS
ncbi:hypothetical protein GCM10027610_015010 [Dactylosporangium cerinum]